MKTTEFIARRRAVYTALEPVLEREQLLHALVLWEEKHASSSKYSLRYFVNDVTSTLKVEQHSKVMLLNLAASMGLSEDQLLPDPSAAIEGFKKRNGYSLKSRYQASELEAFKVLVEKIFALEKSHLTIDIARFVRVNLARLDIDSMLRDQCSRWLEYERKGLKVENVRVADLRKIMNLFYVALCEYCGPERADRLLAEAVTSLKNNGGAAYSEVFAKIL
jgi:hypothetical protein